MREDTASVIVHAGAGVEQEAAVISLVRENLNSVMECLSGGLNQTYVEQSPIPSSWAEAGLIAADETG